MNDGEPARSPRINVADLVLALVAADHDQRITTLNAAEVTSPAVDLDVADDDAATCRAVGLDRGGEVAAVVAFRVRDGDGRARVVLGVSRREDGLPGGGEDDGEAVRIDEDLRVRAQDDVGPGAPSTQEVVDLGHGGRVEAVGEGMAAGRLEVRLLPGDGRGRKRDEDGRERLGAPIGNHGEW